MTTNRTEVRRMIHLTSFLLGVGAALVVPSVSRVIRPMLVEAAVAGMDLFDQARARFKRRG